ncbi:MAG: polysaccharide export protein [Clostridia bacterium]|nr:polysaccharide export protein [Clostridia bacterium]
MNTEKATVDGVTRHDQTQINQMPGSESAYQIDLVELLFRLIDKIKYIVVCAIIGAIAAGLYTEYRITPLYKATSKLYVLNPGDSAISISDLQIGTFLAYDYQEVFRNWHVHERVIQKLDLPYSYGYMSSMLNIQNPEDTRILYITFTSPNPEMAKMIADTYAEVAKEFIAETMDTEEPNLFEEALLPTAPSSPSMVRNITLGFLLGLIISCGWITVQFVLDDKVRTAEDVERYFGIATLGLLPLQDDKGASKKKKHKHKKRKEGSA